MDALRKSESYNEKLVARDKMNTLAPGTLAPGTRLPGRSILGAGSKANDFAFDLR